MGKTVIKKDMSNVYSETETVVGTWIDGKPIYRKVIKGTTIAGGQTFAVAHNISNLNDLINAEIITYHSDNGWQRHLNFAYNNGSTVYEWFAGFAISSTQIVFQCGTSFVETVSKWRAIIEYTKTTD